MKITKPENKATRKELKLDQKAHEAKAKADKLQRHALDTGKFKKAERAQVKAEEMEAQMMQTEAVEQLED
jgi:hypothetical protein